jgi:nucleotide-binding universal stress UspA family protein
VNTSAGSSAARQAAAPCGPFRRVLVAWDGSADSIAALRTAASVVGGPAGHVVALSVLAAAQRTEATDDRPSSASPHARRIRAAFETTRAAIARNSGVRIDLHTAEGRQVAASVCDYAAEHGFDLVVIGRHGDGGLIHAKLGHIAESTARACKIPVLLVSAS